MSYFIKVQPIVQNNKIEIKKDLYSNQFWCIQPSLDNMAKDVTELLNSALIDQNKKARKALSK